MNIPSQLKIGGHTVSVVIKRLADDLEGEWDSGLNTIFLTNDLAPSQMEVVLFHEILHALNRTLDSEIIGHQFLGALAEQLYQVLVDNDFLK